MKKFIKIDLIKDYIRTNNLTNSEFCKLCNIRILTLERILNDDIHVELNAILRISRILKIRLCEMFYDS